MGEGKNKRARLRFLCFWGEKRVIVDDLLPAVCKAVQAKDELFQGMCYKADSIVVCSVCNRGRFLHP